MSQEQRFTAWLSRRERELIREKAKQLNTTQNFVVRVAIRQYFGLDTPSDPESVTAVTSNK